MKRKNLITKEKYFTLLKYTRKILAKYTLKTIYLFKTGLNNSHDTNYLVSRAIARNMADAMANSTYLIHVQLKFTIYVSCF